MKKMIFASLFLFSVAALAADEHHGGGIPTKVIMWQAINLSVLLIGMFFLLRKSVVSAFEQKRTEFLASAEKSQELKKVAEDELRQYEEMLHKLRATSADSLSRATAEAATTRTNMIKEAQDSAQRIQREAKETVQVETRRAERQLKEQLINESIKLARQEISTGMKAEEHQKLQNSFVNNVKAVHS